MGMRIGSVETVSTIGKWSLAVMGPGLEWVLIVKYLFVTMMSGEVALFGLRKVGKYGPM